MPMSREIGLIIFVAAVSLGVEAAQYTVYEAREWHDQMADGGEVDCWIDVLPRMVVSSKRHNCFM